MVNDAGTVALIFNGEIYNHADIRRELEALGKYRWTTDHSDTEVLLHAYEEWGLDCVQRFYGMFAIGIYDARDPGRPVAAPDSRPRRHQAAVFDAHRSAANGCSPRRSARCPRIPTSRREMDRTAFWHYLTFIVTPAPLTLFRGIFKLPAGHALTIDHARRARRRAVVGLPPGPRSTLRPADAVSEAEAVARADCGCCKQSIARRMVSDVPFGVLLSGGVDSSLNVALMSELMDRPVHHLHHRLRRQGRLQRVLSSRGASASRYQTDHHETLINREEMQDFLPLLVRLQDEPIADNVCIPLYFLSQLVQSERHDRRPGRRGRRRELPRLLVVRALPPEVRIGLPSRRVKATALAAGVQAALGEPRSVVGGEDARDRTTARGAGQELFWGGAVCWWGERCANADAGSGAVSTSRSTARSPGCCRTAIASASTATRSCSTTSAPSTGRLDEPEVLQKIPLHGDEAAAARASADAGRQADDGAFDRGAGAVPRPRRGRLRDAAAAVLQAARRRRQVAAEEASPSRISITDLVHRRKQGFGAPMEEWFREAGLRRALPGRVRAVGAPRAKGFSTTISSAGC